MESMPSLLPAWKRGYSVKPVSTVARTEFVSGHAIERNLGVSNRDTMNVVLELTDLEYRVFVRWAKTKINKSDWFIGKYPQGETLVEGVIKFKGGDWSESQMVDASLFVVSAVIEIQDRVDIGADIIDWFLENDLQAGFVDALHDLATNNKLRV